MKLNVLFKKGIVVALTAAMLMTGCGQSGDSASKDAAKETAGEAETAEVKADEEASEKNEPEEKTDEKDEAGGASSEAKKNLAEELKKKYAGAEADYDGNVIKLDRNEVLEIELGYNPWNIDADIYESFAVYQDAELQFLVEPGYYDWNGETGVLTIEPPYLGIAEMDSGEADISHLSGNYLSGDDESGWGTLSQYYLVTRVDVTTGEPLEKPIITVLKINAEIPQAPQLVFDQTEDGFARFSWKEVPGAEGYLLFSINKDETGLWTYTDVFAEVTGTEWTSEADANEFEGAILSLNRQFEQYFISDDAQQWIDDNAPEWNELDTEEDIAYDEYYSEYYGVIAYNGEGCSPISNLLNAMDVAHMLPIEKANYADEDAFFNISGTMGLPAMMSVTMGDGSTAQRVIEYDFDTVTKKEDINSITIMGKGIQTPFTYEFHAYDVNFDTLDADLEALKERQEKLMNKGGNVAPSLEIGEDVEAPAEEVTEPEADETKEDAAEQKEEGGVETSETEKKDEQTEAEEVVSEIDIPITANSAMSEYIALHMLETEGEIDLSAFPESADTEKIIDAFFEAQYQNPLVLGVRGGGIDPEKRILYVEYDFDRNVTAKKQEEIKDKVEEIVSQIIDEDMSDSEKEMAINTYLCENAVYDNDALENAEKYSFTQVDEDFYDSFTAYGILVDGVGVCASYSASFKLLADAAGLDSIVVTGYLDGSVPHAWNKVKVEDQWYIVDSTNNDNDMISNALLNLSDAAAYGTLVENDSFVTNESIQNYAAKGDEMEYYHVTDRYHEREEIAQELAELLTEDGEAVLRTDYDIDDEAFYEIAQQAADIAKENISGFYWMGVIRLQK